MITIKHNSQQLLNTSPNNLYEKQEKGNCIGNCGQVNHIDCGQVNTH